MFFYCIGGFVTKIFKIIEIPFPKPPEIFRQFFSVVDKFSNRFIENIFSANGLKLMEKNMAIFCCGIVLGFVSRPINTVKNRPSVVRHRRRSILPLGMMISSLHSEILLNEENQYTKSASFYVLFPPIQKV